MKTQSIVWFGVRLPACCFHPAKRLLLKIAFPFLFCALAALPLPAASNSYFDSGSDNAAWSTTVAHWSASSGGGSDAVWANGNYAYFYSSAVTSPANPMHVSVGSGGVSTPRISGNGYCTTDLIFNNSTITLTGDTTLSGYATIRIQTAHAMTFNSVLAGSTGAYFGYDTPPGGVFVLGGANTYNGGTIVGAGTVVIQNGTSATGSGSVTVEKDPSHASVGVLTWNNNNSRITGSVTVASGAGGYTALLGPGGGHTFHIGGSLTFGDYSEPILSLSSTDNGANDQMQVGSSLNGGGVQVGISCGGTLDLNNDYVLFTSGGVTGDFSPTPIWTTATPQYAGQYTILTTGNNVVLHFNRADTTLALMTSSEAPTAPGVNVTFTATVSSGAGTPTGDVVFSANGVPFSTVALVGGVASASTTALPLGTNIVAAEYAAQGIYLESNDSVEQVVQSSVTCSQTNAIVGMAANPDGTFTLTLIGTPQAQYYVATSADASAPMSEWVPLPNSTTTVTSGSGLWHLTVTNTVTQQYFRSAAVAPCSGGPLSDPVPGPIQPRDQNSDYGPAIWNPPCNANYYTSGYGHRFLVIHAMDGYYESSISMFKSCGWTSASVHYLVNGRTDYSGDAAPGEITQMVREADYAWHAMCWNRYSLGTEHEGFESNPAWYTDDQYNASGLLQRHLCDTFNIPRDRNHIVGHGEWQNSAWASWAGPNLGINAYCNNHTDPGPYWDWSKFMDIINGDLTVAGPAAVSWGPGRMDVVVRGGGNSIYHKYYDYSHGGWLPSGHFESLGGYSTSDPAICSWAAQRLDVFCRGGDNALWHKWYNAAWSGWENLGGGLSSGPSAVSWGSRRIDVVVRGGGNNIYHKFYDYSMGGWLPKGDFENLGGDSASAPAICSSGPRRLDVFYRGSDNALWHTWFDSNGWSVWENLGGNFADNPDAVSWGPGRMDIVVRGTDSQVYHKWYDYNTGGWHGFENLGGTATSSPAICSSGAGRLDVFCAGSDHALMHKWHDSNGWSGWENLGGVLQ